jgi:hypothetical protein
VNINQTFNQKIFRMPTKLPTSPSTLEEALNASNTDPVVGSRELLQSKISQLVQLTEEIHQIRKALKDTLAEAEGVLEPVKVSEPVKPVEVIEIKTDVPVKPVDVTVNLGSLYNALKYQIIPAVIVFILLWLLISWFTGKDAPQFFVEKPADAREEVIHYQVSQPEILATDQVGVSEALDLINSLTSYVRVKTVANIPTGPLVEHLEEQWNVFKSAVTEVPVVPVVTVSTGEAVNDIDNGLIEEVVVPEPVVEDAVTKESKPTVCGPRGCSASKAVRFPLLSKLFNIR